MEDQWESRIQDLSNIQERLSSAITSLYEHEDGFQDAFKAMTQEQKPDALMDALSSRGGLWYFLRQQTRFNEQVVALLTDLDYRKADKPSSPTRPRKSKLGL